MTKSHILPKRFLIGFIGIFFLFNSLFALTTLEEIIMKKKQEFEKHKPKYTYHKHTET